MNLITSTTVAVKDTATAVAGATRDVFYAGLGLFATAQDAADAFFDRLVREGERVETRRVKVSVSRAVEDLEGRARRAEREAREARVEVGRKVETAGRAFEERVVETVAATLKRMNVPTREDVEALQRAVDRLNEKTLALRAA